MPNTFFCALALWVGAGQLMAAQEVMRLTTICGRHLESVGAVLVPCRESGRGEESARTYVGGVDRGRGGQTGARNFFSPSAAQTEAGDSGVPVASLGALSSRIDSSDRIYVRKRSGEEIAGRFSRASDISLTLEINGQAREIPASEVQQVWQRGGNQVGKGMLFGFLAGAAVAVTAVMASDSKSDWSARDKIFLGTLAGGGAGLIWGGVIGAFVHERPLIYEVSTPTVRLTPVFAPRKAGVILAARF